MARIWVVCVFLLALVILPCTTSQCHQRCVCSGPSIVCSDLPAFPELKFNDTEILTIYNSSFDIPSDAFEGLPNLNTVTMDHVYISAIGPCAFRGMTGGIITLNNALIVNMSQAGVFCDLHQTDFDISNVMFPSISQRTFHNVSTTSFKLHSANITDIHSLAFNDVKAQLIQIFNTIIGTIHQNAFNNLKAQQMELFNASVTTIQAKAFDNMNATDLNLYNLIVITIKTNAFCQNLTASSFKIFNSVITNLEDNAFHFNKEKVRNSTMYNSVITNPGCHALDGLGTTSNLQMPAPCDTVKSAVPGILAGHMMFLSLLVSFFSCTY